MAKKSSEWRVVGDETLERRAWRELLARLSDDTSDVDYSVYANDAPAFIEQELDMKLWQKQLEIANSVMDNRRTIVPAGHAVGKTFFSTALVAYWLSVYEEAIAIVLAPTFHQINNVFWRGLRYVVNASGLPGETYETPRWNISERRYAVGLSPKKSSKEDMASLQGYHSPHLLVILDEATGIPKIMWEAVEGLATGENDRIIALGNPISQGGAFWEATISNSWNTIVMSSLDHPNVVNRREVIPGAVSWGWCDDMVKDYAVPATEDANGAFEWEGRWYTPTPVFMSRVLGQAPSDANDQLISMGWVVSAMGWVASGDGEVVMGVDPARYGGDDVAMVIREGGRVIHYDLRTVRSANPTDEITGWVRTLVREYKVKRIFVDEIGVGAGVVDALRGSGEPVVAVGFGRSARDHRRYANTRAECWWGLRVALQDNAISLPQDDRFTGDLTAPKYWFDKLGRVIIEPKDDIRRRLGHSPDLGDALALTYAMQDRHGKGIDVDMNIVTASRWSGIKTVTHGRGSRWG